MNGGLGARAGAVLVISGLALAAAAWGQPTEKARAAQAARLPPQGHLWWNDADVIAKLSLTEAQRTQMGEIFERAVQAGRRAPGQRRLAFLDALRAGDMARARRELAGWADEAGGEVRATGELKIAILSLLTPEQFEILGTFQPEIVSVPWSTRPSWKPHPRRAPGKPAAP